MPFTRYRRAFAAALLALALPAWAGPLETLETFMRGAHSGRADFTQVVTAPPKHNGEVAKPKTSTGSFAFLRPDRFRFDYKKPFPQTLVADGQTLWLYDPDLNQVTARPQAQTLGSTPAALIAAAPDLASLQRDFDLVAAPSTDGLEWVQATPKARDGQVTRVMVGFRSGQLAALEILDSFGQRSLMTFKNLELNAPLPADAFRFTPPKGADVIRQ